MADGKSTFAWDDPLLLDDQLTEEERMVRDVARRFGEDRLMPVILEWNRQEEFDRELMKEFGHWYIPRRRPEYLRRNALVVLGNSQSHDDREVDRVLKSCLMASEPLVRSHAVWAALRLGKKHLIGPDVAESLVEHDPDGIVRAELDEWGILLGSESQ